MKSRKIFKNNDKKSFVGVIPIISFVFLFACFSTVCISYNHANAKTYYNKKQVKREIAKVTAKMKKTKKAISVAEKQNDSLESKAEQSLQGVTHIIRGNVLSKDPFIVKYDYTYYYIANKPSCYGDLFSTYVRKQSGYIYYNGISCRKAILANMSDKMNAKESSSKLKKLKKKYSDLKYKKRDLKECLVFKLDKCKYKLSLGEKDDLLGYGENIYYNKISWKSSNSSIVSVNKKGVIHAKKIGSAIISGKTSISKKTTKFVVTVKSNAKFGIVGAVTVKVGNYEDIDVTDKAFIKLCDKAYEPVEDESDDFLDEDEDEDYYIDQLKWSSDNPEIAIVEKSMYGDYGAAEVFGKSVGVTVVRARYDGRVGLCVVNVVEE